MIIPWQKLSEETLLNLIESFILREGTDYGEIELSLSQKKQQLLTQIKSGNAVIVWSELHESIDIKEKTQFFNTKS